MAHRMMRDPDADGWERADFPIACETCLGPNPYLRMQRIEFGGECHISGRPYTVFRWRPGADARRAGGYKKTIVCQEVAKAKNVCQVCLLDLTYSVPVQVRDAALGIAQDDGAPKSDVGKEWALAAAAEAGTLGAVYQGAGPAGIGGGPGGQTPELLARLGARTPYYERNRAKLCSFFAKGECKRGAECPYRHEMPKTGPLAKQNIKDRYYGVNDPVANKMLAHLAEKAKIPPPADPTITTLFVGNLAPAATEGDVRDAFARFGALASVRAMPERAAAFVTFAARPDAERAAAELAGALTIRGQAAKLLWGRPQQGPPGAGPSGSGLVPTSHALYPSMDPGAAGTRIPDAEYAGAKRGGTGSAGGEAKRARG